jgi:hypothetical protein
MIDKYQEPTTHYPGGCAGIDEHELSLVKEWCAESGLNYHKEAIDHTFYSVGIVANDSREFWAAQGIIRMLDALRPMRKDYPKATHQWAQDEQPA